jgi:hypothetical protein
MTTPTPAAELFPSAFGKRRPSWEWSLREIPENGSHNLYIASPFSRGYRYYTEAGDFRLFSEYPEGYAADIGYAYKHGPGKVDEHGKPMEDRARPTELWLSRAWLIDEERMVASVIDSWKLMKKIHKIFQNPDYLMLPSGLTNFYLTIYREKDNGRTEYDAVGNVRTPENPAALAAAHGPWNPEAYFLGQNPLEESPTAPQPGRVPATVRDENGADQSLLITPEHQPKSARTLNF